MRTILGTVIAFLIVFMILVLIGMESTPRQHAPEAMEFALQWTLRLFGAITAAASAVGLILIAASKGTIERQVDLVLPLLAGLLLLNANWGLALATGVIGVASLFRGTFGSARSASGA